MVMVMVFNATFNNISAGENHQPVARHRQTVSHNVVSSAPRLAGFELTTFVVNGLYSY